jgi:hypothetical protein
VSYWRRLVLILVYLSASGWAQILPDGVIEAWRLAMSGPRPRAAAGIKVDGFCLLVMAERTFDADGWIRLSSDERMPTLLTPTGLGIEGGVQGAVTSRSTRRAAFTRWTPPAYGQYKVKATGWIGDAWGNRYEGGGTYQFWIANRMTMTTATFQGISYPVGGKYGRDIGFAPAVPAEVEVRATLYVNSDPSNKREAYSSGKATLSGIFGVAQGAKQLTLDAPGEYHGHVVARYTDSEGHLWVCSMRHAGVVYPEDGPIVARGKKLSIGGKLVDRGEFYVVEKERPANAPPLRLDLPEESSFLPKAALRITGWSTAQTVHYAAVITGAVVDQGSLTVNGGKFEYRFDSVAISQATLTYDITNLKTGRPEIFDVVHLTFFSKEQAPGGGSYHSYSRVIIRGTRVLYIR